MSDYVFVSDVDGCMTNGGMWYNKHGKEMKMFGPCDHDAIKELMRYMPVQFITADKRGFDIVQKRIRDEMNCDLELVSHKPLERWQWIKNKFPDKNIIFMGEGIYDFICLRNASLSITTPDALRHVRMSANYITRNRGGNRAVAEAAIYVMEYLGMDWMSRYADQ